jgi:hypothetical protein
MFFTHRIFRASAVAAGAAAVAFAVSPAAQAGGPPPPFIGQFHKIKTIASTVPHNGDVNPYGVAVVRHSQGHLVQGNVLVSNFNNSKNLQGTGTTIVQITPGGHRTVFAHIRKSNLPGPCPGGVGLTTALDILPGGWVVVGSLPTTNGMSATAKAGCLIIVNRWGQPVETLSGHGINGPWDMTAVSNGSAAALFVTNVLNGTVAASPKVVHKATVLRLVLKLQGSNPPLLVRHTVIGSGFTARTDPAALVIGPTGVGLNASGTLFVADSLANRITKIPNAVFRRHSAGTGAVVTSGGRLNTPLGLIIAPNGHVLTVNGGDGLLVETTPSGNQIAHRFLDKTVSGSPPSPPGAGALFGLGLKPHDGGVYYVDDAVNTLRLLH